MKFVFILLFLTPLNVIGYVMQCGLLAYFGYLKIINGRHSKIKFQQVLAFLLLFFGTVGAYTGILNGALYNLSSSLMIIYLALSLFFFPYQFKKLEVSNVLTLIAFLIFLSQIVMAVRLEPLSGLIELVYGRSELEFKMYQADLGLSQISWVRFGGLYSNPNHCAKAYTFIFGLFLSVNSFERKSVIPILIIIFLGILLTGSRTGLVIFMLLFGAKFMMKKILILPLIFGLCSLLLIAQISESRFFDVDSIIKSPYEKYSFLFAYFHHAYTNFPSIFVFGSGIFTREIYDLGLRLTHFDSEIGYLVQGFGLMGIPLFGLLLIFGFRFLHGSARLFLLNLLWTLSSTTFINFRISIIFLVSLSVIQIYHSAHEQERINAKN